jgi:putative endonuclease
MGPLYAKSKVVMATGVIFDDERHCVQHIAESAAAMPLYWYFYLVRCCDHTLYAGITTDLNRRLAEHNAGTASKYTRAKGPVHLVYWERLRSKSAALRREAAVKKFSKAKKERLVLGERGAQISSWEGIEGGLTPPAMRNAPSKRGPASRSSQTGA